MDRGVKRKEALRPFSAKVNTPIIEPSIDREIPTRAKFSQIDYHARCKFKESSASCKTLCLKCRDAKHLSLSAPGSAELTKSGSMPTGV
jgi:hypothetical protein